MRGGGQRKKGRRRRGKERREEMMRMREAHWRSLHLSWRRGEEKNNKGYNLKHWLI